MKKIIFLSLLCLGLMTPLFAESNISDYYPKSMAISKIYPCSEGYKVNYIKSNRTIGTFYAPYSWFKKAGYAEVRYGKGEQYPYATFYYKDGKIDHFSLYLIENFQDVSWGDSIDDNGEDFQIEELIINYE